MFSFSSFLRNIRLVTPDSTVEGLSLMFRDHFLCHICYLISRNKQKTIKKALFFPCWIYCGFRNKLNTVRSETREEKVKAVQNI